MAIDVSTAQNILRTNLGRAVCCGGSVAVTSSTALESTDIISESGQVE